MRVIILTIVTIVYYLYENKQRKHLSITHFTMEQDIDNVLKGLMSSPTTTGCLVANNQGLCIEKRGEISPNAAGIATAILCQASKLEPNSNAPIVALETGKKTCLIHKHGITGVIYKEVVKPGAR